MPRSIRESLESQPLSGLVEDICCLNQNNPIPTLAALARRAEQLRAGIDEALSRVVTGDLKNCPGAPEAVLRGPRMARFCHGYCTCSRVRNEVEAKGLCGGEGELVLK